MYQKSRLLITLGLLALGIGGVCWAAQQSSAGPGGQLTFSRSAKLLSPTTTPSSSDVLDAMYGYYTAALPTGWTAENYGTVEGRDTGIRDAETGETLLAIVVRDDIADLTDAYLYLDGVQVFHATQANGAIKVRNSQAVATMTVFLPAAPYELRVAWQPAVGGLREESVVVGQ